MTIASALLTNTIFVPSNIIFFLFTYSFTGTFYTGTDSPVNVYSSTNTSFSNKIQSQGIFKLFSNYIISPGTRSTESII